MQKKIIPGKTGGAYRNVAADGGHIHHMPADSVSPFSTEEGPGIRMEPEDHMKTASWGSSKEAIEYRAAQQKLIDEGKFLEAQQMDIDDVREKFGSKYDKGIAEMEEYTNELLANNPIEKKKRMNIQQVENVIKNKNNLLDKERENLYGK